MLILLAKYVWLLLPVILAGISNMVWVKLPLIKRFNRPIDNGRLWRDGRPVFGANKTWQGFWAMVFFTAFWLCIVTFTSTHLAWARQLAIMDYCHWTWPLEPLVYGAIWGLGYVIFELPNSFVKRRINIQPGKNGRGATGLFFLFIDQADSVAGCMVFMLVFFRPSWQEAVIIFFLATGIHYLVNILLFFAGLKKQPG